MPALTREQRSEKARIGALTRLTPEQRTTRARIAALERWSREDPKPSAQRGQNALRDKFRREVAEEFPDLDPAELERRAEARYKAHMARVRYARTKRQQAQRGEAADGAA